MSNEETTPDRIPELAGFMKARHAIYLARRAGKPGPWTQDPVLAGGRFCNIFRELDTVTIWIRKHIREPFAEHPNLWLMLAIARYINWPPTLAFLIEQAEVHNVPCWPSHRKFQCGEAFLMKQRQTPDNFASDLTWALTQRAKSGEKVYTGAYMIRAESDPKKPWYTWSKHKYIAEIVIGRLWEDRDDWAATLEPDTSAHRDDITAQRGLQPTLRDIWFKFQQQRYIGWGPFMAYEVVTDLRHTRYLRNAADIMTWANAGPGAIRGLNRLHGRPLNTQPPVTQTCEEMRQAMLRMNEEQELWPSQPGAQPAWPQLEMRDVEHSLCEWDKYERVRLNEGKMRTKYDWRHATNINEEG